MSQENVELFRRGADAPRCRESRLSDPVSPLASRLQSRRRFARVHRVHRLASKLPRSSARQAARAAPGPGRSWCGLGRLRPDSTRERAWALACSA
jgi:hypothetical protein